MGRSLADEISIIATNIFNEPCLSCRGEGYYEDRKYKVPVKCNCLSHSITRISLSIAEYIENKPNDPTPKNFSRLLKDRNALLAVAKRVANLADGREDDSLWNIALDAKQVIKQSEDS